ncbi:MAG: DMT family transporter [Eubacteriales bacterium]|nr:DMT family transporter [Eubacteriales bacterium]
MTDTRSIKLKGVLFSVLSAVIFGTSPIFFKTIVATGINTTTQVVLRSIVTMVLAGILAAIKKQPILLKGRLLVDALMAFVLGQGLTAILLNSSYAYLPAGMSTSLHFVYPSVVMLASVLLFREKINLSKLIALLLSICAIFLMTNTNAHGQIIGVILAVGSGCSYAFYILYLERTPLRDIPVWTFAFWGSLGCLIAAAGLGISTNTLDVSGATVKGISLLMLMVPLQSVLAVRFFQLGVRYSGSTAASLLSTMEPVTSTILGMLILNEPMDARKLIGCAAIVLSVILVVFGTQRSEKAAIPDQG